MKRAASAMIAAMFLTTIACAWAAAGHRSITQLAVGMLPNEMPMWLRDKNVISQMAYESNEPDRWRAVAQPSLNHVNNPDHYLDIESLAGHNLSLRTLPPMRYEFIAAITKASSTPASQAVHGVQRFVSEDVGTLPYAIVEHFDKLVASFNTFRILDSLDASQHGPQMEAARWNIISEMGQLSHFVADAGQPLHTTIHHHGWLGDNPGGYTTDRDFHAYIDVDVVALHQLNAAALKPMLGPLADIPLDGVWMATIGLIERSFETVETLYRLQKSGELQKQAGRELIAQRMIDSAEVLAGLYWRAWRSSEPTQKQINTFVKFNDLGAEDRWSPGPAATFQPAK